MDGIRGLPLLSGPAPHSGESEYCRKCNKEFNRIFNKSKRCNHCGYQFCSHCCSHSALMPRIGVYNGFDPVDVCSYCIEVLKVTAMPRSGLRAMPLSHLKAYMSAYGLAAPLHAVEKEDYVRAVLDARESNGCLPRANEDHYRRHSIPQPSGERSRGFLSRMADSFSDFIDSFPQPDLGGSAHPPPVPPRPNPRPPPPSGNRPPPVVPERPQPAPPRAHPASRTNPNSRPPPQPASHAPRPPNPPAPSASRPSPQAIPMEQLLEMPKDDVSSLSVGVLKAILQHNHVRVPQDALEKRDIVERVVTLIDAARADKERDARARVAEEEAELEAQKKALEEIERRRGTAKQQSSDEAPNEEDSANLPKAAQSAAAKLERDGLCVICQDEDANIAVVDCGHLCLCMECSELVMSSTKECPLCRTRIVTPQRLLRIFKT